MLIFRETEVISGFSSNIGLSFGNWNSVHLSKIGTFYHLENDALDIVQVNEKLIWAHLDNMFLDSSSCTCLSSVFSEIRMKVPELLPQSLM